MDCVYKAWADNINALNLPKEREDRVLFNKLKQWTHGTTKTFTHHAAIPLIIGQMAWRRGLRAEFRHDPLVVEFLKGIIKPTRQPLMWAAFKLGDFRHLGSVDQNNAIYCSLTQRHAYYAPFCAEGDDVAMTIVLFKEKAW